MAEPSGASTQVDGVISLLEHRRLKQSEKKSVFETYLLCVQELFAKMHPDKLFCQHMVAEIEGRWTHMPDENKALYEFLNKRQHQEVDDDCRKIDAQIISVALSDVRTGGASSLEMLPGSNEDKTNPLFWLMVDFRAKNFLIADGDWKIDDVAHQRLAAAKWHFLPLNEQQKLIGQAKAARRLLCQVGGESDEESDKAVRDIVNKKMKEWLDTSNFQDCLTNKLDHFKTE